MTMTRAQRSRFWFYLIVSVVGLVTAWVFNGLAVMAGATSGDYLDAWFTSSLDWVLSLDLLVVALAGSAFILLEGRRLGMRYLWAYILASGLTAFAFTFPLFLAMRERALARTSAEITETAA
ncbi:DUF2834 domain-containing protein [Pontimonas sp.]|uniref:DUF2834 domain-containing protein n=1 Tax=Pontimonas sp. TaxID=2304492 RepID=UPI0028705F03|nr:DUF2834 domain-containing protein [Pontimonas sp.]MDR9397281.1 DUF2834 domain-containing protein [Pontimonas sp.]